MKLMNPMAWGTPAAAVTAKIQAMDAVATNMGVDAMKLMNPMAPQIPAVAQVSRPGVDPNITTAVNPTADWRDRPIRKCGLPRDEMGRPIKILPGQGVQMGPKRPPGDRSPSPRRSPIRRSRDRDSRGRSRRGSRSRSRGSRRRDRSPPREANIPPPTVLQAPLQLSAPVAPPAPAGPMGAMGEVQEKAGQIAMEKKLQDEGEQVYSTLKQQENMQISGKSARQMVMQKLMGARGKIDSVVCLLKNMVGPDEVDEDLHEEIQQECG